MRMTDMPLSTPRVETELQPTVDPLADPLRLLKLTGVLHCRAALTAPWGIDLPRIPDCIAIHIVTEGCCWLDIAGQPLQEINAGSLVMIPHGSAHQLRSAPGVTATPLTDIPVLRITDRYEHMQHGGGGSATSISYCGVRVDPRGAQRLLQVLPLFIRLDTLQQEDRWLQDTVRFIAREADDARPGSEAIITRLADIIVVQAIRAWLDSAGNEKSWLSALRDRYVGRALAEIHRAPDRNWSVAALAREVGLSRSAFSARFTDLVGQPVMQYLTEWRMELARTRLLETGEPLAQLAAQFGYQSEAAFSRAFKRVFGVPPGGLRRSL